MDPGRHRLRQHQLRTNFGEAYCAAGTIIAAKCGVPFLYRFELMGMPGDADKVRQGVIDFLTKGNHS